MKEYAVRHPHNELCTVAVNYTPPHSSLLPSLPPSSSCSYSLLLPLLSLFPPLPPSSLLPPSLLSFLPLPNFSTSSLSPSSAPLYSPSPHLPRLHLLRDSLRVSAAHPATAGQAAAAVEQRLPGLLWQVGTSDWLAHECQSLIFFNGSVFKATFTTHWNLLVDPSGYFSIQKINSE